MSEHNIPEVQNYVEGDSLDISFRVEDLDSEAEDKDLSGAEIGWKLRPRSKYMDSVLDVDSETGITVTNLIATEGTFTISIEKGVTDGLRGRYVQEVSITDDQGEESSATGVITISGIGPEQ